MAEIKITPALLKNTASQLQSTGSKLSSSTKQMMEAVKGIQGEAFTSEAITTFKTKFMQLQDDMERINKMVNEHVKDLQEMATNMERAEQEANTLAGQLRGDVIV